MGTQWAISSTVNCWRKLVSRALATAEGGLVPIRSRLNAREESLGPKGVDLWNLLPIKIQDLPHQQRRVLSWVKVSVPVKPNHKWEKLGIWEPI